MTEETLVEVELVANASDQLSAEREETRAVGTFRGSVRSLWNWFGAAFGIVVLIGVGTIYVMGDAASTAVPQALEPDSVAAPETPIEPVTEPPADPVTEPPADPVTSPDETDGAMEEHTDDTGEANAADEVPAAAEGVEVIEVEMIEFGYVPETIEIEAGVPVILRFVNNGKLPHEAMIGDAHMQEEFASAGDHDDGQAESDDHDDVMATLVGPGETEDLEVVIDEPGEWFMACHLLGHYEQGQIATINVSA